MKTPDRTNTLALLSENGFTVRSGHEGLDFYINEIGWNVRSLLRQTDMLETKILEMKEQQAKYDAATSAGDPKAEGNVVPGSDAIVEKDD